MTQLLRRLGCSLLAWVALGVWGLLPSHSHAATYYIQGCGTGAATHCTDVTGDDSRSSAVASNPATPWASCAGLTAAKFTALAAGSVVAFAAGSVTEDCYMPALYNANATAANPIVFTTYTPSWDHTTGCTYTGDTYSNCDKALIRGTAATPARSNIMIYYNGAQVDSKQQTGFTIHDLHLEGKDNSSSSGIYIGPDTDDVLIYNVEASKHGNGITLQNAADNAGHNLVLTTGNGMNDRVVIRDNNLHDNDCNGMFGAANYALIENNTFRRNGGACGAGSASLDHNLYIGGLAVNAVEQFTEQMMIRGNTLTEDTPFGTDGMCQSVIMVVHGKHNNLRIENNDVREITAPTGASKGGCWGISVDTGQYSSRVEGFTNTVIRNNNVINTYLGISLDLCQYCIVENNNIYSAMSTPIGAIWTRDSNAQRYTGSPCTGTGCDDLVQTDVTIRNNTFYAPNGSAGQIAYKLQVLSGDAANGVTGSNYRMYNNLAYFGSGTTSATQCFNTDNLPTSAFSLVDYNLCFFAGTAGKWDSVRSTLAANQAVGFDTHSVNTDPVISTPSSPFLLCPSAGPARAAGHPTLSSGFSFSGLVRSGTPDIGSCQNGATSIYGTPPDWVR